MTLNGRNSRRNGSLTAITLLLAWKLSRSRDYTPLEREKGSGQLFGVQKWFKYSRYVWDSRVLTDKAQPVQRKTMDASRVKTETRTWDSSVRHSARSSTGILQFPISPFKIMVVKDHTLEISLENLLPNESILDASCAEYNVYNEAIELTSDSRFRRIS